MKNFFAVIGAMVAGLLVYIFIPFFLLGLAIAIDLFQHM